LTVDPLLGRALRTLDIVDPPRPLTQDHPNAWHAGAWKIKTATEPAASAALVHETAAVRALHRAGLYPVDAESGRDDNGVWSAVGWIAGPTLWDAFAPGRVDTGPDGFPTRMVDIADAAFTALDRLHTHGWLHGDIQPFNIVVTAPDTVEFIDLDLTHHPRLLPLPVPYRGGLDHATAPETARTLLDTDIDTTVPLDDRAEWYSLGASLRWAWTGTTPANTPFVGAGATAHDVLADIATLRRRPPLAEVRPWAAPELEALIDRATRLDPADRATATRAPARRPHL